LGNFLDEITILFFCKQVFVIGFVVFMALFFASFLIFQVFFFDKKSNFVVFWLNTPKLVLVFLTRMLRHGVF